MNFRKKYPSIALEAYVKNLWLIEILTEDIPFSQLYFPYGSFEFIYYFHNTGIMQYIGSRESFNQPLLFYSGQFTKPFTLSFNKPCKCFGVSFKPWVGNLIYKIPSNIFTDNMVEIDDIETKNPFKYQEFLFENEENIFAVIESYIYRKIKGLEVDSVSKFIAESIIEAPTRKDARQALSQIGLSKRRIEQRFLASTGLTIGSFTRKVRFQKAISILNSNIDQPNMTQLSYDLGYYDQSHFIREFKEFSATSPLAFSKQNSDLKKFISSLVLPNKA